MDKQQIVEHWNTLTQREREQPMTEADLQSIIDRANAATSEDQWDAHMVTCCGQHYGHPGGGQHTNVNRSWAVGPPSRTGIQALADTAFIKESRRDIPALVAEVQRLRHLLSESKELYQLGWNDGAHGDESLPRTVFDKDAEVILARIGEALGEKG